MQFHVKLLALLREFFEVIAGSHRKLVVMLRFLGVLLWRKIVLERIFWHVRLLGFGFTVRGVIALGQGRVIVRSIEGMGQLMDGCICDKGFGREARVKVILGRDGGPQALLPALHIKGRQRGDLTLWLGHLVAPVRVDRIFFIDSDNVIANVERGKARSRLLLDHNVRSGGRGDGSFGRYDDDVVIDGW